MIKKQRIITAAATFVIAGSVGYVMQNGDALAARFSADDPADSALVTDQLSSAKVAGSFLPTTPTDLVLPAGFETREPIFLNRLVAFNTAIPQDTQIDVPAPFFYPETCDVTLDVTQAGGAMVLLDLNAPCYQNQRIDIVHGGLAFSEVTGSDGTITVNAPALFEYEPFTVTFMDGRSTSSKALVLGVNDYTRVAVNWQGAQNLNIHALEQGAGFGQSGHVWEMAAGAPGSGADGARGFLIELGNSDVLYPHLAEVYSFPNARGEADIDIELIVEAEIDDQSCGTTLVGKSIQISALGVEEISDLQLAFPACDGQNGFLVLKNLLQDLKIAHN